MRRQSLTILIAAAATILVLAAAILLAFRGTGPVQEAISGRPAIGGPFQLTDQHGRTVTDRDFRGKLMLVYFGYTFCPDVCPTELQTISAALTRLGPDADRIAPIFITVDPQRDTPQVLAAYLRDFNSRIVGLTGSQDQIAAAARAYRIYYAKGQAEGPDAYTVDHTNLVFLMDRQGRYLDHFAFQTTPEEMAAGIRAHL